MLYIYNIISYKYITLRGEKYEEKSGIIFWVAGTDRDYWD